MNVAEYTRELLVYFMGDVCKTKQFIIRECKEGRITPEMETDCLIYLRRKGYQMGNAILLNVLFGEWARECAERTMHIDDMKAINRVMELLTQELPMEDKFNEE